MGLLKKIAIGTGIFVSSLSPHFSNAQEKELQIQGKFSFGLKSFNDPVIEDYFGSLFGVKLGGSISSPDSHSRMEIEVGGYSGNNPKEKLEISTSEIGLNYDLVFGSEKFKAYGGVGFKSLNAKSVDQSKVISKTNKASGTGLSIRAGIQPRISKKLNGIVEFGYENISGTSGGDKADLKNSSISFGVSYDF